MNYLFHLLVYFSIYSILAMSLNIIIGYCGLMTIAHAAYFAVGGYVYALASLTLGWGFLPALLLGIGVTVVLSLAVSLPAWRFRGDFFLLVSLAAQSFLLSLLYNWGGQPDQDLGTWANLTNGPFGIAGIPSPAIGGIRFATAGGVAAFSITLAVMCGLLSWWLLKSPWGRLLKAMRDDELAARGLGKNVRLAKLQAFAFACGLASVAGTLYAAYVRFIDPSIASLDDSVLMLCMVIVGGVGNFRGPLVGAFILLLLPEVLRFVAIPDAVAANLRLMAYGVLVILIVHLRPQGVAGTYRIE
jgi:branched-chain amino acid transport system permease protein